MSFSAAYKQRSPSNVCALYCSASHFGAKLEGPLYMVVSYTFCSHLAPLARRYSMICTFPVKAA